LPRRIVVLARSLAAARHECRAGDGGGLEEANLLARLVGISFIGFPCIIIILACAVNRTLTVGDFVCTRPALQLAMILLVHVKQKCISVSCGEGAQPVRWLANVGVMRYDTSQGRCLGEPLGIRLEDGRQLGLTQSLTEAGLQDMEHVWVVFKDSKPDSRRGKDDDDDDEYD
jgi:hypothetical protein